jgi:hypothetical protein
MDWVRPSNREGHLPLHAVGSSIGSPCPVASSPVVGFVSEADRAREFFAEEEQYEIDPDELLEFLAADHDPVAADPVFRDQLRDELWALVESGGVTRPRNH